MKRLVALITAFCLVASPALAGITQFSGTGTGGAVGSATATASTSFTMTYNSTIPVGTLIVIPMAIRLTTTTISGCVDNASGGSNTYTLAKSATGTGINAYVYYTYTTNAISNTTVLTCTQSAAAGTSRMWAYAYNGAATSTQYDVGGSGAAGSATALGPLSATGTLACNTTAGEVVVAFIGANNTITLTTESTGFTTLVTDNTAEAINVAQVIVNSNASQTYSPNLVQAPASGWAGLSTGFKAATCTGSAKHGLLLTGVG